MTVLSSLYVGMTHLSAPILNGLLQKRVKRGKELADRLPERRGGASIPRPSGPLVWLHAASVGEAMSAQPLIKEIKESHPDWRILMTTGTVTSSTIVEKRYGFDVIHQFVPLDHPSWVKQFLDHWRPDQAIWIESEIWPNLVMQCKARQIPMVMVNARLSEKSVRSWSRFSGFARTLFGAFSHIWVQDKTQSDDFKNLGAERCSYQGNLKAACDPLSFDEGDLKSLLDQIGDRPFWLAASTHAGEEKRLAIIHQKLREDHPGLLMILVPRHPERRLDVSQLLTELSLDHACRSHGDAIGDKSVYLADTLGEMGLFYQASPFVFLAGSLLALGGHNPVEPAQMQCALLWGPDMKNARGMAASLEACGAAIQCQTDDQIKDQLSLLLKDPEKTAQMQKAGHEWSAGHRRVAQAIVSQLALSTRDGRL